MKLSQRYILLLLSALVLGIYYPALFAPLCLTDDYVLFLEIQDYKFTWGNIFTPGTIGYYRPLFRVSLWVDQMLWMFDESFMHLDNIVLHLANVILIYFVALRAQLLVFNKKTHMAACGAAAVFAVHPLCSESIVWIPARVDPMAGFFIYLALLLLLSNLYKRRLWIIALSVVSLFLGSLAKEPAVFQSPAFIFMSYSYWRENNNENYCNDFLKVDSLLGVLKSLYNRLISIYHWSKLYIFEIVLFSTLPFFYIVVRRIASTVTDHGTVVAYSRIAKMSLVSVWDPFFLSLKGFGFYFKKMFIPWPLNFTIVYVSDWYILIGVFFILLTFYLIWRSTFICSFFLISIITVLPAIIVLLSGLGWTPYAERYLYISVAPAAIGFMLLIQKTIFFERYKVLVTITLVAIFSLTTVKRNILWTDSIAFYKDCLVQAPGFISAARNYAAALSREGLQNEARDFRRNNVATKLNGELFSDTKKRVSVR